ncbi:UDP-3-O-(3-hydroxymyristoyl)glucosamine N-acyltransferase [Thermodesulfobacterium sp. TA1]|uniref:UDP-3-O-(3-hydroxymyristoyl)glucosamine N-acyltransferase n=1 Tax=Thermodesulfobacterium sp. TA1 TaxID=2234087 RepID=UPI001232A1B5|nr:UDP-3-O-(3-hydroxymyristoyl)glucosamine N-acyltransferase [Thermodesulfobacterium sp. TA1]QER41993.1 UDP-3-O-(3-hydroxymyristoyl)glucosamine N-acyltransferase [Thermodesulfobacterium sp. TA1]
MKTYKLSFIAQLINGKLIGEDLEIKGINALPLAQEDEMVFIDSLKRVSQAKESKAKAVLCPLGFASYLEGKAVIEVKDVRLAFAKITYLFKKEPPVKWGISDKAFIEEGVEIEEPVAIYPNVYIQSGAKIRKGAVLYPGVFVGAFCEIGENTVVYPNAVIYPYSKIGKNCIIHAGVVIGADGFGFAQEPLEEGYRNVKIYHFGGVLIEDEVEIGANSTVDRAVFGATVIGEGTKIDNSVQVGHNVRVGKQNILVSHTAIGGSAVLEDFVMIAGQVGIAPSAKIGKGAKVAAKSGVVGEVPANAEVAGIPAIKANVWRRAVVIFEKLPEIYKELKKFLKTF